MNAQEQLLALASNDTQRAVAQLAIKMAGDDADRVAKKAVKLINKKFQFGWACARALGHK